jgi:uncharacterized protein (TIGR02145 family)
MIGQKKCSLYFTVCFFFGVSMNGQVTSRVDPKSEIGFETKSNYNLDELKVRWKKAALENCTGAPCVPLCGDLTVRDIDNNSYKTVQIGTQCWLKENLKVTRYNDGSPIPDSTNSTWGTAIGALSDYIGAGTPSSGYVGTYGYLYNWYAATDARKICPTGWHVPTDGEWTSLILFIDPSAKATSFIQSESAGFKLKSMSSLWSLWNLSSGSGNDNFGFSALPGGRRDGNVADNIRGYAHFWTASEKTSQRGFIRRFDYTDSRSKRDDYKKNAGLSVRCLRV